MLGLLDLVGKAASSRSTILITGETGTGWELIAKDHPHQFGARRAPVRAREQCSARPTWSTVARSEARNGGAGWHMRRYVARCGR